MGLDGWSRWFLISWVSSVCVALVLRWLLPARLRPQRTAGEAGLRLGELPTDDELWLVAWLRAGVPAVADLLITRALAEGWVIQSGKSYYANTQAQPPIGSLVAGLHGRLASLPDGVASTMVFSIAVEVATPTGAQAYAEAQKLGMAWGPGARRAFHWLIPGSGLLACLIVAGFQVAAALEGDGSSLNLLNLYVDFAMALGGVWSLTLLAYFLLPLDPPDQRRYLDWLSHAIEPLVTDIAVGYERRAAEVCRAVAIVGMGAAASIPELADFIAPRPTVRQMIGWQFLSHLLGG